MDLTLCLLPVQWEIGLCHPFCSNPKCKLFYNCIFCTSYCRNSWERMHVQASYSGSCSPEADRSPTSLIWVKSRALASLFSLVLFDLTLDKNLLIPYFQNKLKMWGLYFPRKIKVNLPFPRTCFWGHLLHNYRFLFARYSFLPSSASQKSLDVPGHVHVLTYMNKRL